jgi:hypothetical protein
MAFSDASASAPPESFLLSCIFYFWLSPFLWLSLDLNDDLDPSFLSSSFLSRHSFFLCPFERRRAMVN